MSIIIEGCNLSGKTTLAKSLNWTIMSRKMGGRGQETLNSCLRLHVGYTIYDRWWMTEYVYDKIFRHKNLCTRLEMWKFKLLSDVKGAVLIFLNPCLKTLKQRCNTPPIKHYFVQLKRVKQVYEQLLYEAEFSNFMPPLYSQMSTDRVLIKHHQLQQRAIKLLEFNVDSWGTLTKNKILFVGEKFPLTSRAIYPFCFRTNKGCGKFFINSLDAANLNPNNVHIINIAHKDGSQGDWYGLIKFLAPRKIIFLGKTAYQLSGKLNGTVIPHPQYWKRFKSKNINGYSKLIKGVVDDS